MNSETLEKFKQIVGEGHYLDRSDNLEHYTNENRGLIIGSTPLVLKPADTRQVSDIMKLASVSRTAIVPQGGHTGHAAGGVPDESGEQIVVSLERMRKVREVDLESNVMICEAGCVLETIQKLADDHDRLFPLALGSQGSCQIGGNISTNAGGTGVLAYGNTRQLVMGLEVVLPNGDIWNGLRRLKKDNTGYDLKDLYIGAEGTLGIVTAAVIKLFPKPRGKATAFCGFDTIHQTIDMLNLALELAGNDLTGFEFMARAPLDMTLQFMGTSSPLQELYPWQVLMEISSPRSQEHADQLMQEILEQAFESSRVIDAAIAQSLSQQSAFWSIRENMPPAQKAVGGSMKHDISLPLHRIAEFLERGKTIIEREIPGSVLYTFGHLGDGNIHYNITQPKDAETQTFMGRQPEINDLIYALVTELNGSVSAEHGIGRLKRELLARTKEPVELQLMKSIKQALDPDNIMNPGKIV